MYNRAGVGKGGVCFLEGWASLTVEGDGNTFAYNEVTTSGAVFSIQDEARMTIEGGEFLYNSAEKVKCARSRGSMRTIARAMVVDQP